MISYVLASNCYDLNPNDWFYGRGVVYTSRHDINVALNNIPVRLNVALIFCNTH